MKECEKHLKKLGSHYMNTASGSPLTASEDGYRDGWRAALKEVMSWYKEMEIKDWDYITCEVRDKLKQELGENR